MEKSWEMLLVLFVVYSVIGWIVECTFSAIHKKKFVNRGLLNGPFCPVYGIGMVVIAVFLDGLASQPIFLFIGSTVVSGVVEWASGLLIEKVFGRRMWDYSNKAMNFNGYTCLSYASLFGLGATISMLFILPLFISWFSWIPKLLVEIVFLVLLGIMSIDVVGTSAILLKRKRSGRLVPEVTEQLGRLSEQMNRSIVHIVTRRMERAFPSMRSSKKETNKTIFAEGCSFHKLVGLFFIGSFIGAIVEMIFCCFTMGRLMSRSSVIYGPFSIVWGLGCVLFTAFLYQKRTKSCFMLFIYGTLMGGTYEYMCSVFTEVMFGTVFWDYSHIPFNIGGRVNLVYCLYWGVAAIVWMKVLYPVFSRWIEKIPIKIGPILSWICIILMSVNILVSAGALARYSSRNNGIAPRNTIEQFLDVMYPDEFMEHRYQNAKLR